MKLMPDKRLHELIYRFDREGAEHVLIDAKSLVSMCKELLDLRLDYIEEEGAE